MANHSPGNRQSGSDRWRRCQKVPERNAPCVLCFVFEDFAPKSCSYVDHDLRGYICHQDSAWVINAEELLHDAGLEIPTDSLSGL